MKRLAILFTIILFVLIPAMNNVVSAQGTIIVAPGDDDNDKDTDGDGLDDSKDKCPTEAGPRTNGGCPEKDSSDDKPSDDNDNSTDDPTQDTDGDGLSDPDDQCPTEGGPTWNAGCPEDQSDPNDVPDPNDRPDDKPPFVPPALPPDGCYVTPDGDYKVKVRKAPDLTADSLGYLLQSKVYAANGYVMQGADIWYALTTYENSTDTVGYASATVLIATPCPQIVVLPDDVPSDPPFNPATDIESPDGGSPTLCHLSVGYDSPTWSDDPQVPSYTYAAFYFEYEPGLPLPAGTQIWGVVYVADFISLPDSVNVFAIAPDPALYEEAVNSGYGGTYNWVNLNGGIQSGDVKLWRLTDDNNDGACGPIVGIDDFAKVGGGADPIADDGPEEFELDFLWEQCPDGWVWDDEIGLICEPLIVEFATGSDCNDNGIDDLEEFFPPDCYGQLTSEPTSDSTIGRPAFDYIMTSLSNCEDFDVWWADLPNPYGDPFAYHDIGNGNCEEGLDTLPDSSKPVGSTRLVAGHSTDTFDCNGNGVPDVIEFPTPDCAEDALDTLTNGDNGETQKEEPGWWGTVLDLTCPGDWIMILEIDADGDEVVTDAQCWEDID